MFRKRVNSLYVSNEVSQVSKDYPTVEVWNDLWMADFVSSYTAKLKHAADDNLKVLR